MMKKPIALQKGDTIGLIAPSSPVRHPEEVERSVQLLEEFGFQVIVGESCHSQYGYWPARMRSGQEMLISCLRILKSMELYV